MKIRRKYLFYVLAFSSAIIAALVASIDATISAVVIKDAWAIGFACFLLGIPLTFLIVLFFSIPIGNKSLGGRIIDPSFNRIRLVKKEEIGYQLIAGFGNAILTLGFFILLSMLGDPSVVLPFSQVSIIYILIIESVLEKNIPTLTEIQSSVIVTFGAILGSISLTGTITVESMAIVFLVINPGWVLFSTYQRKLKLLKINDKSNDSLNIRFWNVVFACMISAILIFVYDTIFGTHHFIDGVNAAIQHPEWIALTMTITFFSYAVYIRALGIGKASVTQAVRSSTILFAIPFSIILGYLGIIEPFSTDPIMLLIKIIGIIILLLGILSFAFTLVKAYIFINIKTGHSINKIMNDLWKIPGVTRVCATSGPYDFIVKIRTRTLVRGYERIIRDIEEIEGIKRYKWQSVLKEWEDI